MFNYDCCCSYDGLKFFVRNFANVLNRLFPFFLCLTLSHSHLLNSLNRPGTNITELYFLSVTIQRSKLGCLLLKHLQYSLPGAYQSEAIFLLNRKWLGVTTQAIKIGCKRINTYKRTSLWLKNASYKKKSFRGWAKVEIRNSRV